MRKAIRNNTTAPAICNERSLRLTSSRNCLPKNMNVRSKQKAMKTSRKIIRTRLCAGTLRKLLIKMGMFPIGSVISNKSIKAEVKVYPMKAILALS